MVQSETAKLLALTLAVVVLFGSGYTFSTFQDSERSGLALDSDSTLGTGNVVTNDVGVSAGNTDSGGAAGNTDATCEAGNTEQDCTMNLLSGTVEAPAAAEPRYYRP